jgi:two-component system chemotaxis sensor kinase CheA
MDDVVRCFVDEAQDNLVAFADAMLRLEQNPATAQATVLVDEMFRNVHTVKGAAGFLAFSRIERVAHEAENVLGLVRSGRLTVTPSLATALLSAADALTAYVADIRSSGTERERDDSGLLAALAEQRPVPVVDRDAATGDGALDTVALPGPDAAAASVRVAADTVDHLLELVGQLVTVRNSLLRLTSGNADLALTRCAQDLSQVTVGLRDGIRAARTQRVGNVWQGLPRLVRDTALHSGKLARLTTEGADIESDRDVLDAVRDPLVHMVRNALDHGIESPQRRRELGKNPEGSVVVRAVRTSGHVVIEVSDDGRGIDPAAVGARAVELGLVSAGQLAEMTAADVTRLVLRAGLSTAESVTNLSGRGVGMDVVRRNVENVGGALDIDSVLGRGTTVHLRLPMSLGITQVLTMAVGDRWYAVPHEQIVDLLRVETADFGGYVEATCAGSVLRWRDSVLPLVDLADLLGVQASSGDGAVHLAVLVARNGLVAIRADRFGDIEEVVVRPLGPQLDSLELYGGAAVLADESIALILDSAGIAGTAGRELGTAMDGDSRSGADDVAAADKLLTVQVGAGRRLAVPLSLVVRVLDVDTGSIEPVGSWDVVRVDGAVLPLVRIPLRLGGAEPATDPARTQVVVVRTEQGEEVGIIVGSVEDIASATTAVSLEEAGLVGMAVVRDRLTGQLDVRTAVAEVVA